MRRTLAPILIAVALAIALSLTPGCAPEDLAELQAAAQTATDAISAANEEVAILRTEYDAIATDPDATADDRARAAMIVQAIESRSGDIARWTDIATTVNERVQSSGDGWTVAEVVAQSAAMLFPPLVVALPLLRLLRRSSERFRGVITAVAAGRGPIDGEATKESMLRTPGLLSAVEEVRVDIGDTGSRSAPAPTATTATPTPTHPAAP